MHRLGKSRKDSVASLTRAVTAVASYAGLTRSSPGTTASPVLRLLHWCSATPPRSRDAGNRARVLPERRPSIREGAGNAGCLARTRGLVCEVGRHTSIVTTGRPKHSGIPCATVLTVSFVISPGTGLSCPRRLQDHQSANLISASGYQDHTTSPSASRGARLAHPKRPSHPALHVRDDASAPPDEHGTAKLYCCFYPTKKRNIFRHQTGHDGQISATRVTREPTGPRKARPDDRLREAIQAANRGTG